MSRLAFGIGLAVIALLCLIIYALSATLRLLLEAP